MTPADDTETLGMAPYAHDEVPPHNTPDRITPVPDEATADLGDYAAVAAPNVSSPMATTNYDITTTPLQAEYANAPAIATPMQNKTIDGDGRRSTPLYMNLDKAGASDGQQYESPGYRPEPDPALYETPRKE